MEISPFPHQGPLSPEQVSGRDDLIADLTERITARRVTALLGPRRYGKTSVLRRVATDMAAGGASVVWVDLYGVTAIADLAQRFDIAIDEASGPARQAFDDLSVTFNISLGVLGAQLSRRRNERPDPGPTFATLLRLLVEGARSTPTVVVIDEFPGMDRVQGAAAQLRTEVQHHVQEIGLVFAGSQPSLMRSMFAERHQPFYAQADLMEISPFDRAALRGIVETGFARTGRRAGGLADAIHELTGGHPHRSMQAADAAWRATPPGEEASDRWATALTTLRADTNLATEAIFDSLSTGEQSLLRLVAHGDAPFGERSEMLELSRSSAQHARTTMLGSGDLIIVDERLQITDPVLADWVRRRFPR